MNQELRKWATFSIGIFVVWGVLFLVRWKYKGLPRIHRKALVVFFLGYFIGWLTATIKFILIVKKISLF